MKVISHSRCGSFGAFNLQDWRTSHVKWSIRVYSTQFSRERGLGLINDESHELTRAKLHAASFRFPFVRIIS